MSTWPDGKGFWKLPPRHLNTFTSLNHNLQQNLQLIYKLQQQRNTTEQEERGTGNVLSQNDGTEER